jgi:predicted nucleic acid-binding protein
LGLERLRAFLGTHNEIALDTSVFIYQMEANVRYLPFTEYVFHWLERPASKGVTSTITMTELLVQPYRVFEEDRVNRLIALLFTIPNLDWIAPSLEIAERAARIRAVHRLRTPDALQAATAIQASATGLITNDQIFERVEGLETLVLERLL